MPKTRQVALIIDATHASSRKMIRGVALYAREAGNWSLYVEEDPLRKLPDLRTWPGDGIIADLADRKVATATRGLKMPLVRVGGGYGLSGPPEATAHFETDNRAIARAAAEHLLERGFTRLAYCGLPRDRHNPWAEERAVEFKRLADEAGCPCWIYTGRHWTTRKWADLQRELSAWLDSLDKPLGLMACNDARARHVLEACRTIGADVPEDVAVVGVDNDEMMCELSNPPLSSVEQGVQRMGYQAAALLDKLMAGKKPPGSTIYVQPQGVVTRQSSDVLAIEDAKVAAALQFIRQHVSERLRVESVAAAVKLSRWTLETRFKAVMGRSIHAEIQRVQIERAKQLVATTDLPLKRVATLSGFKHVQYMTTLFRRHVGHTPGAYRRRWRS